MSNSPDKGTPVTFPALFLCFSLVACSEKHAVSTDDQHKLQVQCSKQAAADFENGKNNFGGITSNFRNHYNAKLNKCFSIITTTYGTGPYKVLYDVNENKDYGKFGIYLPIHGFAPSTCEVLQQTCQSEEEWDALVRPFMED